MRSLMFGGPLGRFVGEYEPWRFTVRPSRIAPNGAEHGPRLAILNPARRGRIQDAPAVGLGFKPRAQVIEGEREQYPGLFVTGSRHETRPPWNGERPRYSRRRERRAKGRLAIAPSDGKRRRVDPIGEGPGEKV